MPSNISFSPPPVNRKFVEGSVGCMSSEGFNTLRGQTSISEEEKNFNSCSDFFDGLKKAVVPREEFIAKTRNLFSSKRHQPVYSEAFDRECEEVKNALLGTNREITQPPPEIGRNDSLFYRLRKWGRQAVYRKLIGTKAANFCHRGLAPIVLADGETVTRKFVDIWKNKAENFGYGGLFTCGSVWVCPVCASKISEHRRIELTEALTVAESKGLQVLHMTLTAPHHLGESLKSLLEKMAKARFLMLNRKPWKRLKIELGLCGSIRALEVTHSWVNGWHVHFHVLLFISESLTKEQIGFYKKSIFEQWLSACLTADLQAPSERHGVDLADGRSAGEYVGKWGIEHEMTKAHIKKGNEGGLSPFDFLDKSAEGDKRYEALFKEYAKAFKGRRQLVWSRGLRELLKMEIEISDEKIAESQEPDSELFAQIPLEVWAVVLRKEKRGEVLEACRSGKENLKEYLERLTSFKTLRHEHARNKLSQSDFKM